MGPAMIRVGFGLLAIVCLVLGGYAGIAAIGIFLHAEDRSGALLSGCLLLLCIAMALILIGFNLGRRVLSGERTWSSGLSRWQAKRLIMGGFFFYLFPIWGPWAEDGALRWPRSDDIPAFSSAIVAGSLSILFGRKRLATLAREVDPQKEGPT